MDGRNQVMEKKRCSRCKRPLQSNVSIKRGLGYVCYRRVKREQAQKEFERIQITIFEFIKECSHEDYISNS